MVPFRMMTIPAFFGICDMSRAFFTAQLSYLMTSLAVGMSVVASMTMAEILSEEEPSAHQLMSTSNAMVLATGILVTACVIYICYFSSRMIDWYHRKRQDYLFRQDLLHQYVIFDYRVHSFTHTGGFRITA